MKKIIKPIAVFLTSAAIVSLPVFSASAATNTANTTINAQIGSVISISSSGAVNLTITPTGSGSMSSASDTVSVSTNNVAGYNLSINMSTANKNLVKGSSNIAPTSGSFATPANLANNTWGYRVDKVGGFGSATTTTETNVANSSFKWAAVPATGVSNTVKTTNTTATNDRTVFWYGAKADSSLPNGTYSGTVVYTAVTK